ncbi:site-2 protease family protein [Patescibacteria group bacterium]|nr:site-2 protease family protein [Patescibacteria group bacterium]
MEITTLIIIAALVMSIVIHEVAHGFMANWLGDPTARLAGRLTLNPVSHADPIGSVILPGFLALTGSGLLFGWAKPVPYNPYNLKNQRWGEVLVAAAGPAVNIVIALVFSLIIRLAPGLSLSSAFLELASYIVYMNIVLAFFNLIPVPPLDGSKILTGFLPLSLEIKYRRFGDALAQMGVLSMVLFIFIFIYVLSAPFQVLVKTIFALLTGSQF